MIALSDKTIFLISLFLLNFSCDMCAQDPTIVWQNVLGGNSTETFSSIEKTSDGGYIVGGTSYSPVSGDKTQIVECSGQGSFGDYWVVKLNSVGQIEWEKTYGSCGVDYLVTAKEIDGGGYIIGGHSNYGDVSGDKTEPNLGVSDFWILKLDQDGNKVWDKTIGDYSYLHLTDIVVASNGTFLLTGISNYPTSNSDYKVFNVNSTGTTLWQESYGGSYIDRLQKACETADGGYLLAGYSFSGLSGDKTENFISLEADASNYSWHPDYWIIKIDWQGQIQWQNTIGGYSTDVLADMKPTADGGFILGGSSYSDISGDKTEDMIGTIDYTDYWVVKVDEYGQVEWDETIGSSGPDDCYSILELPNQTYLVGGVSLSSVSGDKTESSYNSNWDYWLCGLDNLGNLMWENMIGGNYGELNLDVVTGSDGGYVLAGQSDSYVSYDKTVAPEGFSDFWIVKVNGPCQTSAFYRDMDNDGYGNNNDVIYACNVPAGYAMNNADCDDLDFQTHPGAAGTFDGIDRNCNGTIDPNELAPNCLGDFDLSGIINIADMLFFLSEFGCLSDCSADLNGDQQVNISDLLVFLPLLGSNCPS